MNILRVGSIFLMLYITCVVSAQTTINLNAPDGGRKEYIASQEIKLQVDYEFTAGTNDFMWGHIDDRLPGETVYEDLFSDTEFDEREITEALDVGYTPGQEGVSPTGGATYSIPIQIPSGTNGFVPSVSINYNSQSGNGLLGMGWNVAAASMITRVGKTIYHDGRTDAVQMHSSDGFVLDGQRFFATSGSNGANGTTYSFENENYGRVTSYGQSGDGPEWFKVETKNGMTMEFGNVFRSTMPEAGTTIAIWGLTKMEDVHGNYVEYEYKTDNNQLRLHEIRYTGNSSTGIMPYNKVKFYYNNRADKVTKYIAVNTKYKDNYLLDKIVVESDGSVYRNYEFKYGKSKFSFLNSVQELASDGSKLNSTIFKYNEQSSTLTETPTTLDISSKDLIFADFDGDGLDDALQMLKTGEYLDEKGVTWDYYYSGYNAYINNGTTFTLTQSVNFGNRQLSPSDLVGQIASHHPMLGDFNGDGMMDFLTLEYTKYSDGYSPDNINLYIANGSGFNSPIVKSCGSIFTNSWNIEMSKLLPFNPLFPEIGFQESYMAYTGSGSAVYPGLWESKPTHEHLKTRANPNQFLTIGDYNGDGISDILINYENSGKYLTSGIELYGFLRYGTGSSDPQVWNLDYRKNQTQICYNIVNSAANFTQIKNNLGNEFNLDFDSRIFTLRLDSDSKDEITTLGIGNAIVYKISGSFFTKKYDAGYPHHSHDFKLGDFNGDQKTDFLSFDGTNWNVAIGNGAGWSQTHFMSGASNPSTQSVLLADINGDGLSDIVHGSDVNGNSTLDIHYSTGNAFEKESHIVSDGFSDIFMTLIPLDFDGDGRQELAKSSIPSLDTRIIDLSSNDEYSLAKVKNGFNKVSSFEYSNITKDDIYEETPLDQGGTKTVQSSLRVVKTIKTDNGVGGEDSTTYQYRDLLVNRLGVGLLGFGKTIVTNELLNMRTETTNELSTVPNHVALLPSLSETYLGTSGSTLISSKQSTFEVNPIGNKRWEVKLISSLEIDHINRWKTTKSNIKFDDFGNVEESHTSIDYLSSGAMMESVHSTTSYVDDSYGLSIPYLPSTITVEKERNGETPYSRTSTNTYTSKGQLATKVNDVGVTKTYSYDAYGHLISTSTSSPNLPTITSSSTFDNKGRYLTSSTNTLGQTTNYSYYRNLDKLKQTAGITGLITKHEYDKWGALTKTTFPNGRTVTVSREFDINTSTYDENSDPSLSFSTYKVTKAPSDGFTNVTYYDILGREVEELSDHPSGSLLVRNTAYNERGKLHKVTEPHFVSGSAINITEYEYNDPYFRVSKVSNALSFSDYTYDNTGSFSKTTVTQSSGQTKSQYVDATGKTVKSQDHGGELIYEFFSSGLPKSTELAGVELVSMEYDPYGRQTKLTDASAGITQYAYNAYNQLVAQTDANGNVTTLTYDDKGDIASEAISGMSNSTEYDYYTTGGGLNQLKKVTAPNGFYSEYEYDTYGRVTKMKETIGTEVLETTYEYNSKGENTAIVYPSGHRIEYEYTNGVLAKVTDGSTTLFQNAEIDQFGNYTQYSLANGSLIGNNDYDQYGVLERMTVGNSFDMRFVFDLSTGNLQSREDVKNSLLETFGYDNLNRLTQMTVGGVTKNMTYSNNGNKETETDIGISAYGPTSSQPLVKINQQADISPFGSLVRTAPLQTINYTKFDRTKDITEGDHKLTLHYGPYKTRKKTVLENTSTNGIVYNRYYSGGYEKTIDGSGNTQEVHYIGCGNGVTIAYVIEGRTSAYHYLHTDYLGSILAVSDATGNLEFEQNFDAWGRDRNPTDWSYTASANPRPSWLYRGFTGHEHLREFTLINMNARMYDPEVGRMLAVDNYVHDASNSQDYNRYSYARNNPLRYTDPSGESVAAAVIIGAVVGAYLGGASANSTFNIGKWENNATTWIGIGTGALMGGLSGGLAATGQLSFAAGVSVAGVSIGGIALNNTGSNYNLNLFGGSSSSGYNYNLGSAKNRKYNPDPFASNDAYVDYASLPPADPRGTAGALITEFTDAEYLQMGKTQEQIRRYRETGSWLTVDDVATATGGVGVLQSGVAGLMDYAKVLTPEAKMLVKYGGKVLGIPAAYTSIRDAINDPSPGSFLKATVNSALVIRNVNPWIATGVFILDATGGSDYIYKNIDRITW